MALTLIALPGCAATPAPVPQSQMFSSTPALDSIAAKGGLHYKALPVGAFVLTTYARISDSNAPLTIYIEGETRPFLSSPSIDPTPADPLALRLAVLDPAPNVVYIARPCQFTIGDPSCDPDLLKDGRYFEQVMASMNRAVAHFAVPLAMPRLNLVGYGDGGAVAALIAAHRPDVVSLRTIAATLDPYGLARYDGYDGADDLLDPMPIAPRLAQIPQDHYVSTNDTVVPPFLTTNFIKEMGYSACVTVKNFPAATHDSGWQEIWQGLVTAMPVCGKPLEERG